MEWRGASASASGVARKEVIQLDGLYIAVQLILIYISQPWYN